MHVIMVYLHWNCIAINHIRGVLLQNPMNIYIYIYIYISEGIKDDASILCYSEFRA